MRNPKGQFIKGSTGNPLGRPKRADEQFLVDLWSEHGQRAFSTAVESGEQWALKVLVDKLYANKRESQLDVTVRQEPKPLLDNPNVFQICTLVETNDTITKRQKVGRGLRLPVYSSGPNQGERVRDEQLNILTVIANESYTEFAETLQSEIEGETNTKFGVIDARLFEHILYQPTEGADPEPLGYDRAEEIVGHLNTAGLLDRHGKATAELKEHVAADTVPLPEKYESLVPDVVSEIKSITKRLPIKNASERVTIRANKEVVLSPDFSALWDKIKHKTKYHVSIDVPKLVKESAQEISTMPAVRLSPIIAELVKLDINQAGIQVSDPN